MGPMELIAALSGAKSAIDIARTAIDVGDTVRAQVAISEITSKLMDAQQAVLFSQAEVARLQRQVDDSEHELSRLRRVAEEHDRYELFELSPSVFVYRFRKPEANEHGATQDAPLHYICPRCFDTGTKSILQRYTFYSLIYAKCSNCETEYDTGEKIPDTRRSW